ncbi:hypothetical protein [Streptomyces sp. NPDC003863]
MELVDCTLREGGYEYEFTDSDCVRVARDLVAAGVTHIEVGAETGLGTRPDVDDARRVRLLAEQVPGIRVGVLAVANRSTPEDLRRVVECGAAFVRIAAPPESASRAMALVEQARELGPLVALNLLKCYTAEEAAVTSIAGKARAAGADVVYLVDSAGAMLPDTVHAWTCTLRDHGIPVGFHGHDNLSLAVANSEAALSAGASMVDGTLRGIGRSAGNTPIELLPRVHRGGSLDTVNASLLSALAEDWIAPRRVRDRGISSIDILLGEYGIHSEILPLARTFAARNGVLLEDLLREVGRLGVGASAPGVFDSLARSLKAGNGITASI